MSDIAAIAHRIPLGTLVRVVPCLPYLDEDSQFVGAIGHVAQHDLTRTEMVTKFYEPDPRDMDDPMAYGVVLHSAPQWKGELTGTDLEEPYFFRFSELERADADDNTAVADE